MNRLRKTLRENRILILTLVALNLYTMAEGHNFVFAHEVRQQEQERDLRAFSSVFGIPVENLRGHREPLLDRLEPRLSQVEELIRDTWESVALPLSYLPEVAPAGEQRTAAASAQEPSGPSSVSRRELDPRFLERLQRATQDSDKERSGPPVLSQDTPLPWRQVEKKARTEKAAAVVDSRAASSAPTPVPRRVIPKDAPAPEIVALAHSLGDSPGRIFRFVHDEIDFDPKWGADKSPLGTLRERRGSSWDQAWLLQHLLTAAGVDARLEWGEVEIATSMLTNITGVDDAFRAGDLLTTAGVPIVLFVDGSRVVGARLSHVWVKAHLDYIPNRGATPGPGDTWVRMDPSLKRFDVGGGVRLDEEVPFELGDYLQSGTLLSPRVFYEDALAAYVEANNLGVASLEELKPSKSLIAEAFPFVPGTLRAKILTVAGEATDVPAAFQQQVEVQVRRAGGAVLLTWSAPWPAVYGQRLELAWPGATSADQSTLDLNGGVFATPPYEVDLRPVLRVDGADVASGEAIGSAEDVELLATLTPPQGSPTVAFFEMFAGEHAIFTVDFGRIPQETVDRYTAERDAAGDAEEEEAWALALAGAVYLRSLSGDLEHLAALRYRRLVEIGNVVLAVRRGAVSTAADGTPLTFAAAPPSLDLGSMVVGLFPADGVAGPASTSVATLELLGAQGSAREGESLTQALGGEHLTAVGFLTRAVREGQALTRVDATNVDAALAASELSSDAEASVRAGVSRGLIAWISETQLPFDTWDTTGYVLEDPSTGGGGYFVTFERLVQGLEANIVFHSPQDLDVVTAPTDVIATIDVEGIETWTLSSRPAGEQAITVIATGTGPVENALLGQFDPTLQLNGLHELVLTGRGAGGQIVSGRITVTVEGNMKVGHFSLTYLDLAVPLSGLDLEVLRTYDSRDKSQGDFGVGWTLEIRQGSYRNNRPPGDGWQVQEGFLPCDRSSETKSHVTTVRLSDREIYRFRPTLVSLAPSFGGCFGRVDFQFVDGSVAGAQLEVLGNDEVFWANGSDYLVDVDSLEVFVPESVRLRARDGRSFTVHIEAGVTAIEDRNGNSLSIDQSGITHSNGFGIQFERDSADRIAKIVDSRGGELVYTYDQAGDLTVFTDQELNTTRFSYDGDHRLVEIVDPRGIVPVRNEYNDEGRLISTTDAFGKMITLAHDLGGRQEVITDRLGYARVLEYDARGNVARETDRLGRVTTRTFDARDNLLTETDPLGRTTTMTYDSHGDLVSIVDSAGNTIGLEYDTRGNLLRLEDPRGGAEILSYDAQGNLSSRTDAMGNTIHFTYDARGQLTSATDALRQVTSMTYNAAGHLIRTVDAVGAEVNFDVDSAGNPVRRTTTRTTTSGVVSEVTEFVYDGVGRLTEQRRPDGGVVRMIYGGVDEIGAIIDPLGRRTDFAYDDLGRLSTVSFPDGTDEGRTYDEEGRLITFTDRAGRTSSFQYDAEGQLIGTTFADGASWSRAFDVGGQLLNETNARGGTTAFAYDAAGRRTSVTDALGNASLFDYDASGNLIRVVDPQGSATTLAYDAVGRLIATTDPDGSTHRREYDVLGRLESETAPDGTVISYSYDSMGRLLSVTDALGGVTSMTYDERGNRVTLTDANGHVTRFEHDALGRLIRRVLPDGAAESFSYDAKGNRTHATDVLGRMTEWRYDANDRVVEKVLAGGESVTYAYTATGRLGAVTDARGTTLYAYDARDRLVELTTPDGRRLTYGYDADGNRTSLTAFVGTSIQATRYGYDLAGRLTTVIDPAGGSYGYTYDQNGNPQSLTYPNGVTTSFTFDALDRLMGLAVTASDGGLLHAESYTRNTVGSLTRITEHDGTVRQYGYDALQRLVEETVGDGTSTQLAYQFAYDAVGNRLQEVRTDESGSTTTTLLSYDERDRLLAAGTTTYEWDGEGNLLTRNDGTRVDFSWDVENRLVAGNVAGGVTKSFTYDGQGDRIAISTSDASGTAERDLLVDPSQSLSHVVVESDGGQVPQTTLVRGVGLLAALRPEGAEYQHADGLGTIRLVTDAAGSVVSRHSYRAFGEPVASGAPIAGGYFFAGEPYDADLGLAYHRARWLEPAVGRFVSRDPFPGVIRHPGTLHRYAYVQNDPVNRIDPTGLFGAGGYIGVAVTLAVISTITLNALTTFGAVSTAAIAGESVDGLIVSGRVNAGAIGGGIGAGADAVYDFDSGKVWVGLTLEFGLYPLSIFAKHRAFGGGITGGFIVNMDSPRELTGRGSTATWPMSVIHLMPKSLFSGNKAWGLLTQLAKRAKGRSGWTVSFGFSTSGPSIFQIGLRSNDFAALATFSGEFVPYDELDDVAREVFEGLVEATKNLQYLGPEMNKIVNGAPEFFEALSRGYPDI